MGFDPGHDGSYARGERVFTNRGGPIAVFERALDHGQGRNAYRVVAWHGVGGQGKTALRRELERRMEIRIGHGARLKFASLNFETPRHRDPVTALYDLRLRLGAGRRLRFPCFDFAFARYVALAYPGVDPRQQYPELFRSGAREPISDMIGWLADVAILGSEAVLPSAGLLYKYAGRLPDLLERWWHDPAVKRKLTQLGELQHEQLAVKLPESFGFDLWRAFDDPEGKAPRAAILIDTYEALWSGTAGSGGFDTLRTDDWVRELIVRCPGVLFAIFGRDNLRWQEMDARWGSVLEQHLLDKLSNQDAERFLMRAGVATPAVRARLIEGAEGSPFYLDLAVDNHDDLRAAGRTPVPEDFGATPAAVRERFLDHLGDGERKELRLASYLAVLDERLLSDLAMAFPHIVPGLDWPRLMRRSFMGQTDEGTVQMHALMREALQAQEKAERPDVFAEIHRWLFEHFDSLALPEDASSVTEAHDQALLAALEHRIDLKTQGLIAWAAERGSIYEVAARWQALERFWVTVGSEAVREFGEISMENALVLHNVGSVRQAMGRIAEAEALYARALETKEVLLGEQHPHYAETLHNLAHVRQAMGRNAEAELLYERVLATYRVTIGENHPAYATTLHALAQAYLAMSRYVEAASLFERALSIVGATLGERHPYYAKTLHELARVHQALGNYAEAAQLLSRSLAITRATLGDRHPDNANTLHDLAILFALWGKTAKPKTSSCER